MHCVFSYVLLKLNQVKTENAIVFQVVHVGCEQASKFLVGTILKFGLRYYNTMHC